MERFRSYCCPSGPHRGATVAGQGWLAGPKPPLDAGNYYGLPLLRGKHENGMRCAVRGGVVRLDCLGKTEVTDLPSRFGETLVAQFLECRSPRSAHTSCLFIFS